MGLSPFIQGQQSVPSNSGMRPQATSPDSFLGPTQPPVTAAPRQGPQPTHLVVKALVLKLFQELLLPLDLPGVSLGATIDHKDIVPQLRGLGLEERGVGPGAGNQGGLGAGHGGVGPSPGGAHAGSPHTYSCPSAEGCHLPSAPRSGDSLLPEGEARTEQRLALVATAERLPGWVLGIKGVVSGGATCTLRLQHKWLAKVRLETHREHPEFIRKGRQPCESGPKMQTDTSQKRSTQKVKTWNSNAETVWKMQAR